MSKYDDLARVRYVRSLRVLFGEYGSERVRPLKAMERRVARALVGIKLAPPNRDGEQQWLMKPGWEDRLARAGLDPVSCRLRDAQAFEKAWAETELELYEKHLKRTEKRRKALERAAAGERRRPRVKDLYARWRAEHARLDAQGHIESIE